jgi:hypothetical protein
MDADTARLREELARATQDLARAKHAIENAARRSRRWMGAMKVAALIVMATLVVPSWRLSAQGTKTADEQISDLLRRVSTLERGRNTVTAPFKVLDQSGSTIMRVGNDEGLRKESLRGISLYGGRGEKGDSVVLITADRGSGSLILSDDQSKFEARMYAISGEAALQLDRDGNSGATLTDRQLWIGEGKPDSGSGILLMHGDAPAPDPAHPEAPTVAPQGLSLMDSGTERIALGVSEGVGNAALVETNTDGTRVVQLGSSNALGDSGALILSNSSGDPAITAAAAKSGGAELAVRRGDNPVAALATLPNGAGAVQVFGKTGQPVAVLTTGARGDGLLQLSNAAGTPMVEAGTLPSDRGIVRAGPILRSPLGLLGIPGSYITGKND